MAGRFASSLLVAVALVWVTTSLAEHVPLGSTLALDGKSRFKVQKFGKSGGTTSARIVFKANGRFELKLGQEGGFLTLVGQWLENKGRILLTPDPEELEDALLSFLESTIFQFALRGVEPVSVKLKVKLKTRKGEDTVKVGLRIKFHAMLALMPEESGDPEVVESFSMKYRYKGKTVPSE